MPVDKRFAVIQTSFDVEMGARGQLKFVERECHRVWLELNLVLVVEG